MHSRIGCYVDCADPECNQENPNDVLDPQDETKPKVCRRSGCPTTHHVGLAGHWQFENNTRDNSGNDYHASRMNDSEYVRGIYGKLRAALRFDGEDDWVRADHTVLGDWETDGSGMTVAAWVNVHSAGATSWNRFVDVQNGSNGEAHTLYWDADDDTYGFRTPAGNATVSTDIPTGRWVYLTGVVDPSENEISLYQDGSLEVNDSGASTWDDLKVSVGSRYDAPSSDPANATIDQVRVYDRALNDSEIAGFTNTSCMNRQRSIECYNSPALCNTSAYATDGNEYHCNYGQYDDPDENESIPDAKKGTGVCCPKDYEIEYDSFFGWTCSESNACNPTFCSYNISKNKNKYLNSSSDGSTNACVSQVPNLHVDTNKQPAPERRSQACCYVVKDGIKDWYYKDGNVKVYG